MHPVSDYWWGESARNEGPVLVPASPAIAAAQTALTHFVLLVYDDDYLTTQRADYASLEGTLNAVHNAVHDSTACWWPRPRRAE
jgi:hypothetical protein